MNKKTEKGSWRVWKSSRIELWKFQVHEISFDSAVLVKIYSCMHQIFDETIKACVHYFFFFFPHQNKISKKISEMLFIKPKKLLSSSRFSNFCTFFFLLFSFLDHCWFYRYFIEEAIISPKVYDAIMCLNWIFRGKICWNSRPLFIIFNHLFYSPKANFGPLHCQGHRFA